MKAISLIVFIIIAVTALVFYKKSGDEPTRKEAFTSSSSSNSTMIPPIVSTYNTIVAPYYDELVKASKWDTSDKSDNTRLGNIISKYSETDKNGALLAASIFLTDVNKSINLNPPSTGIENGKDKILFDAFIASQIDPTTSGILDYQQTALSDALKTFKGFDSNLGKQQQQQQQQQPAPKGQGSSSSSFSGSLPVGPYNPVADRPATVKELIEFRAKLEAEITRLNSSGATDEVTRARITNLRKSSNLIQDIISRVNDRTLAESNIPIMKSSIDAFNPLSANSPLPDIFTGTHIDSFLKNLLPSNLANDPEVARTISDYLKSMTKNLSWNFGVKYTSNAEHDMAKYYNNVAGQGAENLTNMNLARAGGAVEHQPGNFGSTATVTDPHANTPQEACRGPASFDWKKRSTEICRALKARGERVEDYGCMPDGVGVGSNFSYRGYARMICSRVAANYDTGLGGLVGCPPLDWPGWRK